VQRYPITWDQYFSSLAAADAEKAIKKDVPDPAKKSGSIPADTVQ
jgi:hypothetical protein